MTVTCEQTRTKSKIIPLIQPESAYVVELETAFFQEVELLDLLSISSIQVSVEETSLKNPPVRLESILRECYEREEFDTGDIEQDLLRVDPLVFEVEFDYKINELFMIDHEVLEQDQGHAVRRKIVACELICDPKIEFPFESV